VDFAVEPGDSLTLPEGEAHHVLKVLRGRSGDLLEVVDARRRLFLSELGAGREARVLEAIGGSAGTDLAVHLYQAVPKGRHMDLVVEKATELGAECIVPLVTERGVVRIEGGGKVERWRRVAESAARQSLQLRVPEVSEPVSFREAARRAGRGGVLLHNGEGLPRLEGVVGSAPVSLLVGPEGGWSEEEMEIAGAAGLSFAQLGPYRLRSETAGMVAVARAAAVLESPGRE
jgi:16S rRNA (uracil1498-N3)-methyltransferase